MIAPGLLNAALEVWVEENSAGGLAEQSQALSASYRKGQTSSHVSLAAYVATRVPATFAANTKVQAALAAVFREFAPHTLLDVGAGPGVASWAAVAQWSSIDQITMCEQDKNFTVLAAKLNVASGIPALASTEIVLKSEATLGTDIKADLVTASYVLAELPVDQMAQLAKRMWARTTQVLVLIEPGTPQGFARLRAMRDALMQEGAHVLAPCTHQNQCPIQGQDWCHFKTRVQRSRQHMHAKQAMVPFEDEAFSYLIVSRQKVGVAGTRIISPVTHNKVSAEMRLCGSGGFRDMVVASRDKPSYKRAKKAQWGDLWE